MIDDIDINYYFIELNPNGRWYLWALGVYGTGPYKMRPLDGYSTERDAIAGLEVAWQDVGHDVVGMDVYDYRGEHIGELDIRRPLAPERAETRQYPSADYPNELLSSKAGR